eukprot:6127653-Pyramimonas_sp.AAC.1
MLLYITSTDIPWGVECTLVVIGTGGPEGDFVAEMLLASVEPTNQSEEDRKPVAGAAGQGPPHSVIRSLKWVQTLNFEVDAYHKPPLDPL